VTTPQAYRGDMAVSYTGTCDMVNTMLYFSIAKVMGTVIIGVVGLGVVGKG